MPNRALAGMGWVGHDRALLSHVPIYFCMCRAHAIQQRERCGGQQWLYWVHAAACMTVACGPSLNTTPASRMRHTPHQF